MGWPLSSHNNVFVVIRSTVLLGDDLVNELGACNPKLHQIRSGSVY